MDNPNTDEQRPEGLPKAEALKEASLGLYGGIPAELGEATTHFTDESVQLLKFHGTYQQDNRDTRLPRKKQGLEKEYTMMVRTRFPGGAITAEQYLLCDELCAKYGQNDIRATSRQTFQFHGVLKGNLRSLLHDLNHLGEITTIATCGDVVRNVTAAPVADIDPAYEQIGADLIDVARQISLRFSPKTTSYYDLWLNDEKVTVNPDGTVVFPSELPEKPVEEPLYGRQYLPRKFKIGVAADFDNSIDVYTNDIGIIAATRDGRLEGYEVLVGGGLGHSHQRPNTYPRLATPLAFVQPDELFDLVEAIVKVQRDHGDRTNRKHARMKYLIDDLGEEAFRAKVFEYAGREYPVPRGVKPSAQPHYLGWHRQQQPGRQYVGVWVENGRIKDTEGGRQFRSGLRAVVEKYRPDVRLTAQHNMILANIRDEDVDGVQALLDQYKIPTDRGISTLRRLEMACPALPLCPLATSEAERTMPGVMAQIEAAGHADADVIIRISGCPNSCSRPVSAEIGIIGKGKNQYVLTIGGDYLGTRLTQELLNPIKTEDLAPVISHLLDAWKNGRSESERFGDWALRTGLDALKDLAQAGAASQ